MKDKNVAGILALIFGVFGVHRFYLGQTGLGILYLLLFFFTLGTIPALLGLIDAVLLFVMNKDTFDDKYNRQSRNRDKRGRFADEGRQSRRRDFEDRKRNRRSQEDDERSQQNKRRQPRYHKRPERNTTVPTYSKNKKINPYKAQGIQKFKDYNFDAAIEDFVKALNVDPNDIALHWNIACAYSMEEQVNESLFHLAKAVELGFVDFNRIKTHDALAYVRSTDDFDVFVKNSYKVTKEIKVESKEETPLPEIKQLDAPKQNILDDLKEIPKEKEVEVPANLLEQIQKLSELRDKGYLSEEEFAMQKKKILR